MTVSHNQLAEALRHALGAWGHSLHFTAAALPDSWIYDLAKTGPQWTSHVKEWAERAAERYVRGQEPARYYPSRADWLERQGLEEVDPQLRYWEETVAKAEDWAGSLRAPVYRCELCHGPSGAPDVCPWHKRSTNPKARGGFVVEFIPRGALVRWWSPTRRCWEVTRYVYRNSSGGHQVLCQYHHGGYIIMQGRATWHPGAGCYQLTK